MPLIITLLGAVIGSVFSAVGTSDFMQHLDRQVHAIHCSFIPGAGKDEQEVQPGEPRAWRGGGGRERAFEEEEHQRREVAWWRRVTSSADTATLRRRTAPSSKTSGGSVEFWATWCMDPSLRRRSSFRKLRCEVDAQDCADARDRSRHSAR